MKSKLFDSKIIYPDIVHVKPATAVSYNSWHDPSSLDRVVRGLCPSNPKLTTPGKKGTKALQTSPNSEKTKVVASLSQNQGSTHGMSVIYRISTT